MKQNSMFDPLVLRLRKTAVECKVFVSAAAIVFRNVAVETSAMDHKSMFAYLQLFFRDRHVKPNRTKTYAKGLKLQFSLLIFKCLFSKFFLSISAHFLIEVEV